MAEEATTNQNEENEPFRKNLAVEDLIKGMKPADVRSGKAPDQGPDGDATQGPTKAEGSVSVQGEVKQEDQDQVRYQQAQNVAIEEGRASAQEKLTDLASLGFLEQASESTQEIIKTAGDEVRQAEEEDLQKKALMEIETQGMTAAQIEDYKEQMAIREMIRQRQMEQQKQIAEQKAQQAASVANQAASAAAGSVVKEGAKLTALKMGFAPVYFPAMILKKIFLPKKA